MLDEEERFQQTHRDQQGRRAQLAHQASTEGLQMRSEPGRPTTGGELARGGPPLAHRPGQWGPSIGKAVGHRTAFSRGQTGQEHVREDLGWRG